MALRPGDALATAWRGEALSRQDHFAEAEPFLREAVAKDPKIAYAWNNLGRCLNERKPLTHWTTPSHWSPASSRPCSTGAAPASS